MKLGFRAAPGPSPPGGPRTAEIATNFTVASLRTPRGSEHAMIMLLVKLGRRPRRLRPRGTPVVTRQHPEDSGHLSPARGRHPLDPLDAAEITLAVEILRRDQPVTPEARFVSV